MIGTRAGGRGRFGDHDVRRGMDVYDEAGGYLGSVVRVELRRRDALSSGHPQSSIEALVVGTPWRRWRWRRVDARQIRNVSMERVVLANGR